MLSINMDDVMKVLGTIKTHLTVLGVILVVAIIAMIACKKMASEKKYMVRAQSGIAILLAFTIIANLICTGPMKTMLDLISGSGTIKEETSNAALELCTNIAEEGMVLLQDEENILPLADTKLNVFGWASTAPCYGGTGSGALNDAYPTVSLLEGLSNAGIETNTTLSDFYTAYKDGRPAVGMWNQDWTLPEPNVSQYTDDMMNGAKDFSDTAMIVITRVGGEGADLPYDMPAVVDGSYKCTNSPMSYDDSFNEGNDWDAGDTYLQLTNREEEMIDMVCSNFDKVVLVYNGANPFQLGFVQDYPQIKGVVWTAGTGQSGFNALGEILTGAVNPSGRMIDTFVYDLKNTPWWNNFGMFNYDNMDEHTYSTTDRFTGMDVNNVPAFVNYVEGIYVGYKFYETAAAEGLIDYDATVQYPFGYGLSYTTFEQKMGELNVADGQISFDVTVTNTGAVAGKDVVEVFFNPPYTNGGIEKASANLIEFAKTDVLEPGASQTLTISFAAEDLASYDANVNGCYVLDAGDYQISINSDSHNVIDSKTYTVETAVIYNEANKRASDAEVADNKLDLAKGTYTVLSRADGFANYAEATAAPSNYSMSEESKAGFYNNANYLTDPAAVAADEDPDAAAVTLGAKNGIELTSLRGLEYDDPQWDAYLDQLTLSDMDALIALGGYQTNGVESIGKVRTNDCDGPASINNNFTGVGSIGFPAAVMIAATWNKDLAAAFGDSIGAMANEMDVSGWYAPAMNIHRTAFAGRNFEYYSEDGVLSGYIALNAIKACQDNHQVYAYMKHFALNDQETNRCAMVCTWADEQTIREIYLKPFEMSVKEGGCKAVMSSFNYIGNRWAGGCHELQTDILRGEWGFVGMVLTDYFGVYGYMSADMGVRNGTDFCLVNYPTETSNVRYTESNGAQQAMRTASKNILFTVVNSRAYDEANLSTGMASWQKILIVVDILVAALVIFLELKPIRKGYAKRKNGAVK